MDVNSINNNISNLNPSSQQHIERTNESHRSNEVSKDDASNVSISSIYNKKRDELSQTLQTLNEGIAINEISKNGLEKQQSFIQKIEDALYDIKDTKAFDQNKEEVKTSIIENLNSFNQIAENTTYKNEKLLTVNQDDDEIISISTNTSAFTLVKPETKEISSSLAQSFKDNGFGNENDIDSALYQTAKANNQINEIIEKFNDIESRIEKNARDTITEQIELSKENSSLNDIDFGAEVADFSKTNINSHVGFLVGSQANIIQEQSVRLLSK